MSDFLYWWPALFVPFVWVLILSIISRVGGWSLLAKVYPAQDSTALDGESWKFQTLQMRWGTHYGNCVTVRVNPLGLGLSVLWILRMGHPPLLIPWADITLHKVRRSRFFPPLIEFRFRLEPSIPVRIGNQLSAKILDSSDRYHPNFRRNIPQLNTPSSDEVPKPSHF